MMKRRTTTDDTARRFRRLSRRVAAIATAYEAADAAVPTLRRLHAVRQDLRRLTVGFVLAALREAVEHQPQSEQTREAARRAVRLLLKL
jgi:DNA-binding FrmR family transcriptional regulator